MTSYLGRALALLAIVGSLLAAGEAAAAPGGDAGARTHGMTVPAGHPRLWFDEARLARARAWFKKNPFTPRGYNESLAIAQALHGLLAPSEASCRAALKWAIEKNDHMGANATHTSAMFMDYARWFGEAIVVTYDWCHAHMTPAERARFVEQANLWVEARRVTQWGAVPMHQNNYYWGYLRNQLLWGIASWDVNRAAADRFLADAIETRLRADFHPAALSGSRGGVCQEGSQYGPYLTGYSVVAFTTAGLLGRDLYEESPFWKEAVWASIYATTPGPTVSESPRPGNDLGYLFFPHSDLDGARWTARTLNGDADYMAQAAMRWSGKPLGRHARHWLATTRVTPSAHVQAVDPGGPSQPYAGLPLDYYAAGVKYLYGRTAWSPGATAFFLQLGDRNQTHVSHQHVDWGSWQLWRNGRFVSRETVAYSEKIAGYAGGPPVNAFLDVGHNLLLIEGAGISTSPYPHFADAVVTRLESRPAFVFAATDLTRTRGARKEFVNPHFVSWVREFVFVRPLETLVVLDRVEADHAADTRTFLAHCETKPVTRPAGATCTVGTQALEMTNLVPAQRSYRVVAEGGPIGQFRIEVDTRPGTPQSYVITVLQAKDAAAPALTPSLVEGPGSFKVTLDGRTSITFEKGMTSSGGSIEVGGAVAPFSRTVQEMVVTEEGPVWR